jgi:betaine lipid synthase
MQGLTKDVNAMTSATTIEEQKNIWDTKIRPAIFSPMLQKILHNPMFMWNALGGKEQYTDCKKRKKLKLTWYFF